MGIGGGKTHNFTQEGQETLIGNRRPEQFEEGKEKILKTLYRQKYGAFINIRE